MKILGKIQATNAIRKALVEDNLKLEMEANDLKQRLRFQESVTILPPSSERRGKEEEERQTIFREREREWERKERNFSEEKRALSE